MTQPTRSGHRRGGVREWEAGGVNRKYQNCQGDYIAPDLLSIFEKAPKVIRALTLVIGKEHLWGDVNMNSGNRRFRGSGTCRNVTR